MKKTFNAVAWMRKRRTEIDKEDQGLSWKEKTEKTRNLLENDPLWRRLRKRLVEPKSVPDAATRATSRKLSENMLDGKFRL